MPLRNVLSQCTLHFHVFYFHFSLF
jgi:hypothetical protein